MTPTTFVEASKTLLAQLASPAARTLALAAAAGLALAASRVKATNVRLHTWTAVLYAALAMPVLGWMLPPLPVPTPTFVQSALHSVRQNRMFNPTAGQASANESSGGASRGTARDSDEPQRGERLTLAQASTLTAAEVHASPSPLPSETPTTSAPAVTAETSKSFPTSIPWSTVAAGIYLAVALFLQVRFLVGLAFSRRLLRSSQIIDDRRLTIRMASRAHASGLAIIPPAAESEFISVPVTMGALRSTILLPAAWREWDDAKLDAVVAHEVSHVARRDALTQRLSLLHRAIFWFSPLAWWLDRHLANLAEQASDEAALSCGADRKHYATTLLEFFEALQATPGRVWWQGVSMAKAGQAEKRVERILSWKGTVSMGFKESSFKKSAFKKSIAVAAVALAVPVVYLAASARPANSNAKPQDVYLAQDQTPPPAPRPAPAPEAQPDPAPAPAAAPTPEVMPSAEPSAQPEPAPAPHAIVGTITGTIRSGIAAVPPAPGVAPVEPIAPISPHALAGLRPVAPVAAMPPPAPAFAWSSQSSSGAGASHSSHGRGSSYSYGYVDDGPRFVIASGKTDSLTMSGLTEDAEHVEKLKKTIPGDFIWFERDEKSYIIRDQATIDRARKLWEPQEELGRKQEALGKQQEALGAQQEELGKKMEQVRVSVPDMTADLDKLKAELKQLSSSATMEQIGNIQSEIGDLQSKIGDLQSKAGDEQSKLGEQMGALGDKQGKLGDEQGKLGEQQGELARQATRQMKQLLDEAITKGTAQPEP
jgi:beta-lactamase regulating signal transducer with metallopeptidase domain